MTDFMKRAAGAMAALLLTTAAASAAGMLEGKNGMTLYVFDKDKGGVPSCYADCAAKWPPYLVKKGEKKLKDWSKVKRTDGAKQWAYDGKPLYFYAGDTKAGDMTGDGLGGVWHIIAE